MAIEVMSDGSGLGSVAVQNLHCIGKNMSQYDDEKKQKKRQSKKRRQFVPSVFTALCIYGTTFFFCTFGVWDIC